MTDHIVITDSAEKSRQTADDGANHTTLALKFIVIMTRLHTDDNLTLLEILTSYASTPSSVCQGYFSKFDRNFSC